MSRTHVIQHALTHQSYIGRRPGCLRIYKWKEGNNVSHALAFMSILLTLNLLMSCIYKYK
jgi:hypothetical protein